MTRPSMSADLRVGRLNVSRRLVGGAFVLLQLNESRAGSAAAAATAAAIKTLAAQTGLIQVALIWSRRDQQTFRRLGWLEVPTDRRARHRRIRGAAARAGLSLHGTDWRFRSATANAAVRPFTGTFRAVGLDGRGVQITITEAVASESLGGQIVPGFGLGVLKARRWSLMNARIPV